MSFIGQRWLAASIVSSLLALAGCSGGGDTATEDSSTAVISGRVSLSNVVGDDTAATKPLMAKAMAKAAASGKLLKSTDKIQAVEMYATTSTPYSKVLQEAGLLPQEAAVLGGATIELYDANQPELLDPIARTLADANGDYIFDKTLDGSPIPAGNYTLIASKYDLNTGTLYVAVQTIVESFAGNVGGNDLVAQDSDAVASVISVLGQGQSAAGGYADSTMPQDAGLPVTFSMAMARGTIPNIKVTNATGTVVAGTWKISPDLLSAMFFPTADLTLNELYTITIPGGKILNTVNNVYGKAIPATITAKFTAVASDTTSPTASALEPVGPNIPVINPIRFGVNEPIDTTTINVAVTRGPSLGAKPAIQFIGKDSAAPIYKFVYQIMPSEGLKLNTDYTIKVTDGMDLAGNPMDPLSFSFKTEATSAGISASDSVTVASEKVAVKDVFGKWLMAMQKRDTSLFSSYMSGDFFWISQPGDKADVNRDGRLSVNEFTGMLSKELFPMIEMCSVTLGGDVTSDIVINPELTKAIMSFNLTFTPGNTLNSQCGQMASDGPGILSIELRKRNGMWLMTKGVDGADTTKLSGLKPYKLLELDTPADAAVLPDPGAQKLTPSLKWVAGTYDHDNDKGVATPEIKIPTYAVVLLDERNQRTGWVALYDASTAAAGDVLGAKFNPMAGTYGNTMVLPNGQTFGMERSISELVAGGKYRWAVLGLSSTLAQLTQDTSTYTNNVVGSSMARKFSVGGNFAELALSVSSVAGVHTYNPSFDGYDVGGADTVDITVTTPNPNVMQARLELFGYKPQMLFAMFTNGVATFTGVPLSKGMNHVTVCEDVYDPNNMNGGMGCYSSLGLTKEFNAQTSGGLLPQINFGTVYEIDATGAESAVTLNSWSDFDSTTATSVRVTGTVAAGITGLNWQVHGENGERAQGSAALSGGGFDVIIPVYPGWNGIEFMDDMWMNFNRIGVRTSAGSVYVPDTKINSISDAGMAAIAVQTEDFYQLRADAGNTDSVTLTGTFNNWDSMNGSANWNHCMGENCMSFITGGPLTVTPDVNDATKGNFTLTVTGLVDGWNQIDVNWCCGMNGGAWYRVLVFTTNGNVFVLPHSLVSYDVGAGVVPFTGSSNWRSIDVGAACSIKVNGSTNMQGMVWSDVNYYDPVKALGSYQRVETQTSPVPDGNGNYPYNLTANIYGGVNDLGIYDPNGMWQGLNVTTTCANKPVIMEVTGITDGAGTALANNYGMVDAGMATTVRLTGTAKAGATLTANISGQYMETVTAVAGAGNTFTMDLPIYNGYNYINLTDGSNWFYLTVVSNGTRVYVAPFSSIFVDGGVGGAYFMGGWGTGESWNNSLNSTVNLSGLVAAGSGNVTWYQRSNTTTQSGTVTPDVNGIFQIPVTLFQGYNGFDLYDGSGRYYYVEISSAVGIVPPKLVSVVSHADGAMASGPTTITVEVDPGYAYANVNVYVRNWGSADPYGTEQRFTTDPNLAMPGSGWTLLNASGLQFSATADLTGTDVEIYVEALSADYMQWHGQVVYVNSTWTGYSWKPTKGLKGPVASRQHVIHQYHK
ncbi:MAG: Ig-like domain-containing protein [Gammaproteobacteria bacterium]|nr:Ig-like domain-containing protein [Gammaproteobacteria bacterium]